MKRLVVLLLLLTPWVMHSMEPEEVKPKEVPTETLLKRYLEGGGRWVRLVEEVLPGYIPPSSRISQVIAQKILGRPLREFILSHVSLPYKDFVGHTRGVLSAVLNPAGDKVVTGSNDRTAKIWNTATGELLHTLEGHTNIAYTNIVYSAFNPTGDNVVTASVDGAARIWDTETGRLLHTLEGHGNIVQSVAFNPAGDKVITGSGDGAARIWNTATGELIHTLEGQADDILSVAFNPAGDKVVTVSHDGAIRIWNTETGELLHTLEGHNSNVQSAAFNPAGNEVVTGAYDGTARIWNTATGKLLHTLEHTDVVWAVAFNSAGDKVITGSYDNTARIWNTATGKLLHTLAHTDWVRAVAFNSAGDKVITGSYDNTARIWNTATEELFYTLEVRIKKDGVISAAAFNPAGDKVLVAFGNKVRICDVESFFSSEKFLAEDITLRQAAILNEIFELGDVKALQKEAFVRGTSELNPENITFDFNQYPHLWEDYNALPEAIKGVFDPHVTKLYPSAQEQAPIVSKIMVKESS